jgi:hypothetical protein
VDFSLPSVDAAATARLATDVVVAVPASNMAVVEGAVVDFKALGEWLRARSGATESVGAPKKRLLIQASGSLPARDLALLYALAADAGFGGVLLATHDGDARR